MELILKRISDLPEQSVASLTGDELVIVGNNGVLQLVPLSAIYTNAQSQLDNVANLSVVTLQDIQNKNFTDTYVTYDLLAQAIQSLGLLLTPSQQQQLLQHLVNYNNPHRVTAEQVGLGNVANFPPLTETDLENNNYGNKYVTYNILEAAAEALGFRDLNNVANYPPTTLTDIQNGTFGNTYLTYNLLSQAVQSLNIVLPPLLRTEFLAHLTNYNNPHEVTAEQVGLGNVVNLPVLTTQEIQAGDTSLEAYVTYNLLSEAIGSLPNTGILTPTQKSEFLAHLTNYDNPHQVTAEQVGLGNVANLPPISNTDITNVNNGSSPDDVYVTYNMLQAASNSLGYKSGFNTTATLSAASSGTTLTTIAVDLLVSTSNLSLMQGTSIAFNYMESNGTSWTTAITVNYNNTLTYSNTFTGLTQDTTYKFQVVISNPNNSAFIIQSNILEVSTLSGTQLDENASFDIVGFGTVKGTTIFNENTVTGINVDIKHNRATALEDGSQLYIKAITQQSGQPNFTSFTPTISMRPKNLLSQNTLGNANIVYPTNNINSAPQAGDTFVVNSNDNLYTVTQGNQIDYKRGIAFNGELVVTRFFPQNNLIGHLVLSSKNFIYTFGGQNYVSSDIITGIDNIYGCVLDSNDFITANFGNYTGTLPYAAYGIMGVEYNGFIFLGGGCSGTPISSSNAVLFNNFYRYTVNSDGSLENYTPLPDLPVAVGQGDFSYYNGYIYFIGGFTTWDSSGTVNCNLNVYYISVDSDGNVGTWQQTTSLPSPNGLQTPYESAHSIVRNGYIYVIGGFSNSRGKFIVNNSIYYAAINSDGSIGSWQSINSFVNGENYYFADVYPFLVDNELYVQSHGWQISNDPYTTGIYKLNIDDSTGSITDIEMRSGGMYNSAISQCEPIKVGSKIYLIGGFSLIDKEDASTVSMINIDTNNGVNTPVGNYPLLMPYNASLVMAIANNGFIYILGGDVATLDSSVPAGFTLAQTSDCYYISVDSDGKNIGQYGFAQTSSLPVGLMSGRPCIIDNTLFYIGGINSSGATNTIYYTTFNSNGTLNNWQSDGNTLPYPCHDFGLIQYTIPGTNTALVYILGGGGASARINNCTLITFSGSTISSVADAGFQLPIDLGYFAPVLIGNYIYIFGGSTNYVMYQGATTGQLSYNSQYRPLAYRLEIDPSTGQPVNNNWEEADNKDFYLPSYGEDGAMIAVSGNYLYKMGGWTGMHFSNSINRSFIYENGNLGPWENCNCQLIFGTNNILPVVLDNIIYIFGGKQNYGPNLTIPNGGNAPLLSKYPSNKIQKIVISQATMTAQNGYQFPTDITSIYQDGIRQPVGMIGSGDAPAITPNGKPIANGEVITTTYNSVTGNGTEIQLGLNNLQEGDEVLEFKGVVYD